MQTNQNRQKTSISGGMLIAKELEDGMLAYERRPLGLSFRLKHVDNNSKKKTLRTHRKGR